MSFNLSSKLPASNTTGTKKKSITKKVSYSLRSLPEKRKPKSELKENTLVDSSKDDVNDSPTCLLGPQVVTHKDFEIWEDKTLAQDQDSISADQVKTSPVSDPQSELNDDKENHIDPLLFPSSSNILPPQSNSKSAFSEIKVSTMPEYQPLAGQSFPVNYSPASTCNGPKSTSLSCFKLPVSPLKYSSSYPPPSDATRSHDSGQYRALSVNLFKTGSLTSFLNPLSPTTPRKAPDYIHPTRICRRVFPCSNLKIDSSNEFEEFIAQPPQPQANIHIRSPSEKTRVLRPRPTPKPDFFSSKIANSVDEIVHSRKKKKFDYKK